MSNLEPPHVSIVDACVAALIGLLGIFTRRKLKQIDDRKQEIESRLTRLEDNFVSRHTLNEEINKVLAVVENGFRDLKGIQTTILESLLRNRN